MSRISRRQFVTGAGTLGAGLALSSFLTACGQSGPAGASSGSAAAGEPIKVQLVWIKNVQAAGALAVEKMGFDKELGFTQEIVPGGPQVDPIQSVLGGTAPFGHVGSSDLVVEARAKGLPIKCFGVTWQRGPGGLMSLADNAITSMDELVGKKIGVVASGRSGFVQWLALNGITEDQVEFVTIGFDPAPLVSNQVDVIFAYAFDQPVALAQRGIKTHLLLGQDTGLPTYGDVLFAPDKYIDEHPDILANYLKADRKGWQYFIENPKEVADYAVSATPSLNLDAKQQLDQSTAEIPFLTSPLTEQKGLLWMEASMFENAGKRLVDVGQIEKAPAVEDVMTMSILEQAFGK